MMGMTDMINMAEFHFLRPQWLWGLIVVLGLAVMLWRHQRRDQTWSRVCDDELLDHMVIPGEGGGSGWLKTTMLMSAALTVLALAGPVWERLEQPVYRAQGALVVILDLSRSMDTADIKPSRVARARLKLIDILNQRREGQTALIVYAAKSFVVSPLTEDSETIISQVSSLETSLMPAQGGDAGAAVLKAIDLMQQAGMVKGDILLLTDGLSTGGDAAAIANAKAFDRVFDDPRMAAYTLSIMGVGTAAGAPVKLPNGGFQKDRSGAIMLAKLNERELRAAASRGGGRYQLISATNKDIDVLLGGVATPHAPTAVEVHSKNADVWVEMGPWLLLLVLPLVLMVFRRGVLVWVLMLMLPLAQPEPVWAADDLGDVKNIQTLNQEVAEADLDTKTSNTSWLDNLWSRPDQRAAKALAGGDATRAATLFEDTRWRASAQYQAGDYQASAEGLADYEDSEALYNKANALARAGDYQGAIEAYDAALEQNPEHVDAKFNRELIADQLPPSEGGEGEDGEPGEDGQEGEEGDPSDQQQGDDSQEGESSDQSPGDESKDDQSGDQPGNQNNDKESDEDRQENQDQSENEAGDEAEAGATEKSDEQDSEQQQANEQWLRRIPDNPGGLLKRKFQYQYRRALEAELGR